MADQGARRREAEQQPAIDEAAGAFSFIFLNSSGAASRKKKFAPPSSSPIRSSPPSLKNQHSEPPIPEQQQQRHSFTFPIPVSLPPAAIPLDDPTCNPRSRESRSASPSAPGSPRGSDAFGSPFSVAACPSGDYRRRADLIRRLRLYSQERLSSLAASRRGLRRDGSSEEFQEAAGTTAERETNGKMEAMDPGAREGEGDAIRADQSCCSGTITMGRGDDFDDSDSSSDLFDLQSFGDDGPPFQSSQLPVYQHRDSANGRITTDNVGNAGAARAPHGYGGFSSCYAGIRDAGRCVFSGDASRHWSTASEAENGDGESVVETEEEDMFRTSSFFTINGGEAARDMNLIRRLALLGYKDLDFRGGNDARFTHASPAVSSGVHGGVGGAAAGGGEGVLGAPPQRSSGYGGIALETSAISSSPFSRTLPVSIRTGSKPSDMDSFAAPNHHSWRSSRNLYQS